MHLLVLSSQPGNKNAVRHDLQGRRAYVPVNKSPCYVVLISRFIEARSHDAVTQFPPWRRLSVSLLSVWNSNNTSSSAADVTTGYSNMCLILITNVKYTPI